MTRKRILFIIIATLFTTLSAKGQNLLFIDDHSFPSTETYTLKSNVMGPGNLDVMFAKDRNTALFGVSKNSTQGLELKGQLIIYLDDGSVIKLKPKLDDFVDNTTKAVYELTESELSLMENSNINTVRYVLEHDQYGSAHPGTGTFTASNKEDSKIDFPTILAEFFDTNRSRN